jgi:hypothetical protein
MYGKIAVVLLSGVLFACAQAQPLEATAPSAPPPAAVQTASAAPPTVPETTDRVVTIRGADCERLLQLSNEDRATASMFYIGYQASRFRAGIINVGGIPKIQQLALSYCIAHPNRPVAEAFAAAYAAYLRSRRA